MVAAKGAAVMAAVVRAAARVVTPGRFPTGCGLPPPRRSADGSG
ncbi:MAG: hypothetical protein ACLUQ6_08260 [Alistipes onderdonkii]